MKKFRVFTKSSILEGRKSGGQEGKLFKAIEQRSVIADEVPQSEKIAQRVRDDKRSQTDTALSPNRRIALSPSNKWWPSL